MIQSKTITGKEGVPVKLAIPMRPITRAVQWGSLLVLVGFGCLFNAWRLHGLADINLIRQASDASFWGTLLVSAGIGLLLGSGVVYLYHLIYLIAKRNVE